MRSNKRKTVVRLFSFIVVTLSLFNIVLFMGPVSDGDSNEVIRNNEIQRALSIGSCEWENVQKPRNAPQDTDLFATLIASFPGSGKRMAFMQLEGMTALRASDDYNITAGSYDTKFAFKKTNYPHHDGIWDWGALMKQVVLLVRNPRWALPAYHHLLYEIEYSDTWYMSYLLQNETYTKRPPIEDWIKWRDARFDVEIKKWGWFIDFWMEGGLLRDMLTNEYTSSEHFGRLKQPTMYASPELIAAQELLGDDVPVSFDEHCLYELNCAPAAIASYENLINVAKGPAEIERFVAVIQGKLALPIVDKTARECVWHQMIVKGNTFAKSIQNRDEEGPAEHEYNFTLPQMETIQSELERVRAKYSAGGWVNNAVAQSLVGYVNEYIADNNAELIYL